MEPESLYFLRFHHVEERHEELLKLSLSTPIFPSSSPSLPDISHQNHGYFPSNNPNSRERLFDELEKEDHLDLSLSIGQPGPSSSSLLSRNPNPKRVICQVVSTAGSASYQPRVRRNPFQKPKKGKGDTIAAPYPWATTQRATVYNFNHLLSQGMNMISGEVECNGCQETYRIKYNLEEKFKEIKDFVSANKFSMNDRAPTFWTNPKLESCGTCGNSLKPVIPKKREINWLFLFLGQMLGCCKLRELKYFCKHTKNHRTGAKDRLIYLAYLGLCKQLDPDGPFDV
ncbi:hypothetical protein REPUB_Repub02eG0255300 [Reevesia pubescens]